MKRTKYKKKTAFSKKKMTFLWMAIGLFIVVSIFFTIQTATSGAELSQLEHHQGQLSKENQELKSEIIRSSSLTDIGDSAEELGFIKPQKVFYISEEVTFAKVQ